MNKNKLIITGAITLMCVVNTATAFAGGWQQSGNTWRYIDRHNQAVINSWQKSGDFTFYLDDNGNMAKNKLIDDNGRLYGVNEDGAMLTDAWGHYYDEDDDEHEDGIWYYFGKTGKAKENSWETTGTGHRYHFTDYKMDEEWYSDDNDNWYFLNDKHDGTFGSMIKGWKYISLDDNDYHAPETLDDEDAGWFYFDTSGKMVKNKEKRIKCADGNDYYFLFGDNGMMKKHWAEFENRSGETIYKYYEPINGARVEGWLWLEDCYADDEGRDTDEGWYFFKKGIPYSHSYKTTQISDEYGIAKINNKYYCFDENGKMVIGKVEADDGSYFYFDENERNSGQMLTGKVKIKYSDDLDDDTYYFKNSGSIGEKGISYTGVYKGYLYDNGVLARDEDEKYSVQEVDGKAYLVNKSGKVQKEGRYKDSDNDIRYKVEKISKDTYDIYIDDEKYIVHPEIASRSNAN